MTAPDLGICLPVTYIRCRDGDTVVLHMRTGSKIAVRMIGVDAPELREPGGQEAADALHSVLVAADELRIFIPLAETGPDGQLDVFDVLRAMTFDRVPAYIFADGRLVS